MIISKIKFQNIVQHMISLDNIRISQKVENFREIYTHVALSWSNGFL